MGYVVCTTCGGGGMVATTEIYIDSDGKAKSRVVMKPCGTCGGRGGFHV